MTNPDPVFAAAQRLTARQRRGWARYCDIQAALWADDSAAMADMWAAIALLMAAVDAHERRVLREYADDWTAANAEGQHRHALALLADNWDDFDSAR